MVLNWLSHFSSRWEQSGHSAAEASNTDSVEDNGEKQGLMETISTHSETALQNQSFKDTVRLHTAPILLTSLFWCTVLAVMWLTSTFRPSCTHSAISQSPHQHQPPHQPQLQIQTLHCGNSTTEARALNCIYDPLTVHWIPSPCHNDPETTAEYKQVLGDDWYGYGNANGTGSRLNEAEMSERAVEKFWYTTRREHVYHCAYSFRRLHKQILKMGVAMDLGGDERGPKRMLGLDQVTKSLKHTQHCGGILIDAAWRDPKELDVFSTMNSAKFSTCDILIHKGSGKVMDSISQLSQEQY